MSKAIIAIVPLPPQLRRSCSIPVIGASSHHHHPTTILDSEAELRAYLGPAPPGYEWHHLIEQTGQFRPDLTSPTGIRNWIQHTDNMVVVPVIKHYCISGLMSGTRQGVRLRDLVRAHSPPTQRAIGFSLLRACGVIL